MLETLCVGIKSQNPSWENIKNENHNCFILFSFSSSATFYFRFFFLHSIFGFFILLLFRNILPEFYLLHSNFSTSCHVIFMLLSTISYSSFSICILELFLRCGKCGRIRLMYCLRI